MQVVTSASGIGASKSEEAKESLRLKREEDHDDILTFHAVIFEEQRRRTGRDATCASLEL